MSIKVKIINTNKEENKYLIGTTAKISPYITEAFYNSENYLCYNIITYDGRDLNIRTDHIKRIDNTPLYKALND
jgi:hypothetical protein